MRSLVRAITLASLSLLAACASQPAPSPEIPPAVQPPVPAPAPVPAPVPPAVPIGRNAVETGVKVEAPRVLKADEASRALAAFKLSCPAVTRRTDASGLTQNSDWQGVCVQAATLDPTFAPGFFFYSFDWVKVGDGRAFATGYYEPEIEGSRTAQPGYTPIYRLPTFTQSKL